MGSFTEGMVTILSAHKREVVMMLVHRSQTTASSCPVGLAATFPPTDSLDCANPPIKASNNRVIAQSVTFGRIIKRLGYQEIVASLGNTGKLILIFRYTASFCCYCGVIRQLISQRKEEQLIGWVLRETMSLQASPQITNQVLKYIFLKKTC